MKIEFWMGGEKRIYHEVSPEAVTACYLLPKGTDRFEYWRKITGDDRIRGPILIWSTDPEMEIPSGRR